MYTSAKVGDIGLWRKRKALAPFDQKWQAAIRRSSFLGVQPEIIPNNAQSEGCPNCLS
jgi:hypothetical protein